MFVLKLFIEKNRLNLEDKIREVEKYSQEREVLLKGEIESLYKMKQAQNDELLETLSDLTNLKKDYHEIKLKNEIGDSEFDEMKKEKEEALEHNATLRNRIAQINVINSIFEVF
jgi:hypothetical protein